jgi:hypothetical protein
VQETSIGGVFRAGEKDAHCKIAHVPVEET